MGKYHIVATVEIEDDNKDLANPLKGRLTWALDDYMVLDAQERKAKLHELQVSRIGT